ncbi:MAG: CopG family antitoxin [Blastocatellia bacterium]
MARSRSSISKAPSYQEIGGFWDTHDLADYWDQTSPAEFDVNIESETIYYPVERDIAAAISSAAKQRGVPPTTLLNLWLQECIAQEKTRT